MCILATKLSAAMADTVEITITTQNKEDLAALKALAKALKLPIKTKKKDEDYSPAFKAKMARSQADIAAGRVTKLSDRQIDNLCL